MSLAAAMYLCSREDKFDAYDKRFSNDYAICFIWICMSTFGPYIIQYSTVMNQLYHKGLYQKEIYNKHGFCKKMYLRVIFTCAGLILMPLIDLLIKVEAILNVLLLLTFGKCVKNGRPLKLRI